MSKYEGHTPGPWKWEYQPDEYGNDTREIFIHEYSSKQQREVCRFDIDMCDIPYQEYKPNAALISDAPTLLAERDNLKAINTELVEAVELTISWVENLHPTPKKHNVWIACSNALVKAKEMNNV